MFLGQFYPWLYFPRMFLALSHAQITSALLTVANKQVMTSIPVVLAVSRSSKNNMNTHTSYMQDVQPRVLLCLLLLDVVSSASWKIIDVHNANKLRLDERAVRFWKPLYVATTLLTSMDFRPTNVSVLHQDEIWGQK